MSRMPFHSPLSCLLPQFYFVGVKGDGNSDGGFAIDDVNVVEKSPGMQSWHYAVFVFTNQTVQIESAFLWDYCPRRASIVNEICILVFPQSSWPVTLIALATTCHSTAMTSSTGGIPQVPTCQHYLDPNRIIQVEQVGHLFVEISDVKSTSFWTLLSNYVFVLCTLSAHHTKLK